MPNIYIYDAKRTFWPTNAPANKIPIIPPLDSTSEISSAKTIQDALQMIVNGVGITINGLPKDDLDRDSTLRQTIAYINQIVDALRKLEPKKDVKP